MISIKDYAAQHGISYEAARQQIARYSGREVDGFRISEHINKVGRTQYLDDDAIDFLNDRRSRNPVIVQQEGQSETIERMRARIDALQNRLIEAQDEYRTLLQDKHAIEMQAQKLLEDKQQVEDLRASTEAAEKRAEIAEGDKEVALKAKEEAEKAKEEAEEAAERIKVDFKQLKKELEEAKRQAAEDAARLKEEAEAAEQSEKEARERADRMENAGLFARIFRSW